MKLRKPLLTTCDPCVFIRNLRVWCCDSNLRPQLACLMLWFQFAKPAVQNIRQTSRWDATKPGNICIGWLRFAPDHHLGDPLMNQRGFVIFQWLTRCPFPMATTLVKRSTPSLPHSARFKSWVPVGKINAIKSSPRKTHHFFLLVGLKNHSHSQSWLVPMASFYPHGSMVSGASL